MSRWKIITDIILTVIGIRQSCRRVKRIFSELLRELRECHLVMINTCLKRGVFCGQILACFRLRDEIFLHLCQFPFNLDQICILWLPFLLTWSQLPLCRHLLQPSSHLLIHHLDLLSLLLLFLNFLCELLNLALMQFSLALYFLF